LRTALDRFDQKGAAAPAARVRAVLRATTGATTEGLGQRSDV
jgi:hypothetical protein